MNHNNINVLFFSWRTFYLSHHHRRPPPTSRHAVLAFLAPVLLDFIELKFQGKNVSSFETHQKAIWVAIASLILYCFAYEAKLRLPAYSRVIRRGMVLLGSVSSVSLTSILFSGNGRHVFYLLYALFLASESAVIRHRFQMVWNWVYQRIIGYLLREWRRRMGRAGNRRDLLPRSSVDICSADLPISRFPIPFVSATLETIVSEAGCFDSSVSLIYILFDNLALLFFPF
ncbi:hypothetical protein CsSME_00044273 [Camellia sinensis var. sinensis]